MGSILPGSVFIRVRLRGLSGFSAHLLSNPIYGTRDNRDYLKQQGIRFAGKPLGRPKKETESNREELKQLKAQRREEYLQRIPIEGKFGQGKNGYRLNYIRAKRADTSVAWINSIFLVMNLALLLKVFFPGCKQLMFKVGLRSWLLYQPIFLLRQLHPPVKDSVDRRTWVFA